jgi:hypothetical protein
MGARRRRDRRARGGTQRWCRTAGRGTRRVRRVHRRRGGRKMRTPTGHHSRWPPHRRRRHVRGPQRASRASCCAPAPPSQTLAGWSRAWMCVPAVFHPLPLSVPACVAAAGEEAGIAMEAVSRDQIPIVQRPWRARRNPHSCYCYRCVNG